MPPIEEATGAALGSGQTGARMGESGGMRFILVFLVLFMSIGVNLPEGIIARMGFEPNYLKAALAAWVITGLTVCHRLALIVLVTLLCIGANLPADWAAQLHINRDALLATLVAIVLTPLFRHHLE